MAFEKASYLSAIRDKQIVGRCGANFVIPLGTRALQIGDANVHLDKTVALSPPNQFLVQDPAADRLSLKISTSTGLLSGKFLLNAQTGQWVTLRGVILQGEDIGAGFFLENAQSGQLDLGTAVVP